MTDIKNNNNPVNEMTAGQMMFNARTAGRRKRELATIARQLCVKEEFLDALERCDYKVIPELVHVLGFARNYAIELGLNPVEIIAKIKQEMGIIDKFAENNNDGEKNEVHVAASFGEVFSGLSRKISMNWKLIAGLLAAVVIVIVAIKIISFINVNTQGSGSDESIEQTGPQIKFSIPVKEYFGNENRATATVVLQAITETWLKIENTKGETVFSRVLVAGDVYYAPEWAKATLGNAGGVDIWVNGDIIPKLGALNTRKTGIMLNADSLLGKSAPVVESKPVIKATVPVAKPETAVISE